MSYQRWRIPPSVAAETAHAFRRGQYEVFAIWTAAVLGDPQGATADAEILRCVVPDQAPGVTATGVWVHIQGQELQRIQLDNYRRRERSVVQLHTHPGADVRMSQLDRDWEVVRHVGALSIIVPFYGAGGLRLHDVANVYEREADNWRLWSRTEAAERLVLE
jgi:proteasome lid subunit RPN8/RPN11